MKFTMNKKVEENDQISARESSPPSMRTHLPVRSSDGPHSCAVGWCNCVANWTRVARVAAFDAHPKVQHRPANAEAQQEIDIALEHIVLFSAEWARILHANPCRLRSSGSCLWWNLQASRLSWVNSMLYRVLGQVAHLAVEGKIRSSRAISQVKWEEVNLFHICTLSSFERISYVIRLSTWVLSPEQLEGTDEGADWKVELESWLELRSLNSSRHLATLCSVQAAAARAEAAGANTGAVIEQRSKHH